MTRRKTDGERISTWVLNYGYNEIRLAARSDRLVRKRMAQAWEEGNASAYYPKGNPYRGRAKK